LEGRGGADHVTQSGRNPKYTDMSTSGMRSSHVSSQAISEL